jgi:hypothetical protein
MAIKPAQSRRLAFGTVELSDVAVMVIFAQRLECDFYLNHHEGKSQKPVRASASPAIEPVLRDWDRKNPPLGEYGSSS